MFGGLLAIRNSSPMSVVTTPSASASNKAVFGPEMRCFGAHYLLDPRARETQVQHGLSQLVAGHLTRNRGSGRATFTTTLTYQPQQMRDVFVIVALARITSPAHACCAHRRKIAAQGLLVHAVHPFSAAKEIKCAYFRPRGGRTSHLSQSAALLPFTVLSDLERKRLLEQEDSLPFEVQNLWLRDARLYHTLRLEPEPPGPSAD